MPFGGYLFLANYRVEGFDSLTEKNSPFFPPEKNGTHVLPNYRHVCREMKMLTAYLKGKNPFPSCQRHAVMCFLRLEANVTTKCHLSFVLLPALGYSAHLSTGAFYQLTQLLQCWILPKGLQDASLSVLG